MLTGQVAANDFISDSPQEAQDLVAQGIENATGSEIDPALVAASFENLTFTNDPIASSLRQSAKNAEEVGLLEPVDLDGIYNLKLLNKVLKSVGEPTVKAK